MAKTNTTAAQKLATWKATMSFDEAAEKLGISAPYMHQLVNGRRRPSIEVAARIERIAGIPARLWAEQAVERVA